MGTTYIKFKSDDHEHNLWKKGQQGYIEGYVRGYNNVPCAVVVIESTRDIVLAPITTIKFIELCH